MKRFILLGLTLSKLINASIHLRPHVLEYACKVPEAPSFPVPDGDNPILPISNECSDPKPDSCSFYPDCLEAHLHCGPSGYPIGYGLHYCEKFSALRGQMSAAGKMWVTNTMLCLQRDLVAYGDGSQTTTCDALKLYAFATHADCYVKGGICTLSPTDWVMIIKTVSFKELFGSLNALKATLQTVNGCIGFYLWLIGRDFERLF